MNSDHLASDEHATPPDEQPNRPALAPELKAAWVKALRSGEYRQGKGWLRRDGTHCCLGVLCEITQPANPVDAEPWSEFGYRPFDEQWPGVGLEPEFAHVVGRMNDDGLAFSEIADYIEANL